MPSQTAQSSSLTSSSSFLANNNTPRTTINLSQGANRFQIQSQTQQTKRIPPILGSGNQQRYVIVGQGQTVRTSTPTNSTTGFVRLASQNQNIQRFVVNMPQQILHQQQSQETNSDLNSDYNT